MWLPALLAIASWQCLRPRGNRSACKLFLPLVTTTLSDFCNNNLHNPMFLNAALAAAFTAAFPLSTAHRWKTEKLEISYHSLPLTKISEGLEYATISTYNLSSLLLKPSIPFYDKL